MVGTERSAHQTIQTRAVANDAAGETLVVTLTRRGSGAGNGNPGNLVGEHGCGR